MLLMMIAQVPVDPISGGAGWIGAGLLGLVLGWLLLMHLPAKAKESKEEREAFGKSLTELSNKFTTALDGQSERFNGRAEALRTDFASSLKIILTSSEKQLERVCQQHETQLERVLNQHERQLEQVLEVVRAELRAIAGERGQERQPAKRATVGAA